MQRRTAREGREVERDRAAERHVVLGQAAPDGGRDDHRTLRWTAQRDAPGGALGDRAAEQAVDHHRQMRAMLLHGCDRDHDDRLRRRPLPQLLGRQFTPSDAHRSSPPLPPLPGGSIAEAQRRRDPLRVATGRGQFRPTVRPGYGA